MSSEANTKIKTKKSGRTPEQQAAREARKAAKLASSNTNEPLLVSKSDTIDETESPAESSKAAQRISSGSPETNNKKRRRGSDIKEEDLLEVDLEAPTPLNKKEARAAKKRAKRGGDEDVDNEGKSKGAVKEGDRDGEKKEKEKPVERKNSIWIGNLAFKTTPERLKEWLENGVKEMGGEEACVTRVNLPKEKVKGKGQFTNNKGFAYVDFSTPENQAFAVQLSEKLLEGRKLLIKLGNDHTPKADATTPKPLKLKGVGNQPHGESATLFVGNLPFDATEEGLRDMIEANAATKSELKSSKSSEGHDEIDGQVEGEEHRPIRGGKNSGLRKVRLGAFQDTGKCKGFAFLDFYSPAEATSSLTNRKNQFYGGRRLVLQYASEEATKRSGSKGNTEDVTKKPRSDKSRLSKPDSKPATTIDESETYAEDSSAAIAEAVVARLPVQRYDNHNQDDRPSKKIKSDVRGKKWEAAGRPRPGAALAMAKRENVAIVAGQGTKVVFD